MHGVRSSIVASFTRYGVGDADTKASLPLYRGKDAMAVESNTRDVVLDSCIKEVNTRNVVLTSVVVKVDITYAMSAFTLFCHQFDLCSLESWR